MQGGIQLGWIHGREKMQQVHAATKVDGIGLSDVRIDRSQHACFEHPVEDKGHRSICISLLPKSKLVSLPLRADGVGRRTGEGGRGIDHHKGCFVLRCTKSIGSVEVFVLLSNIQ